MADRTEKIVIDDDRHFDYGYTYGHNRPGDPFEFVIYNKKNNGVRARVLLDKTQLLGLAKAICEHLGEGE